MGPRPNTKFKLERMEGGSDRYGVPKYSTVGENLRGRIEMSKSTRTNRDGSTTEIDARMTVSKAIRIISEDRVTIGDKSYTVLDVSEPLEIIGRVAHRMVRMAEIRQQEPA